MRRFSRKWWQRHFGGSWNEPLGRPECPFARRWHVKLGAFSLRLHHWTGSDDPRYHHDHGWWFLTFVLKGGYDDLTPNPKPWRLFDAHGTFLGAYADEDEARRTAKNLNKDWKEPQVGVVHRPHRCEPLRAPTARLRPSRHVHTVRSHDDGAWTLLVTGPHLREWGYHVESKFVRAGRYFRRYGVHPCD